MRDQLITFRQWIREQKPAPKSLPCRGCDRPKFDGVKGDGLCGPCPRFAAAPPVASSPAEQSAIEWEPPA